MPNRSPRRRAILRHENSIDYVDYALRLNEGCNCNRRGSLVGPNEFAALHHRNQPWRGELHQKGIAAGFWASGLFTASSHRMVRRMRALLAQRIRRQPLPGPGCIICLNARLTNNGALTTHSHPDRNRWLIAIGVLKLLKAALFVSMGFGVIRLLHKDIADVLLRAVMALRFDPENRIVNVLLEKSALLSPHRLKEISFAIFLYAALDTIEGTGLVLEKVWAEYFTLILTGSFLPWELYEIIRHLTVWKVVLTLLNLLVFIYLAYVVNEKVRARQNPSEPVLIKKDFGSR